MAFSFYLFVKAVLFYSLDVVHLGTLYAIPLFTEAGPVEHRVCSALALYYFSVQ